MKFITIAAATLMLSSLSFAQERTQYASDVRGETKCQDLLFRSRELHLGEVVIVTSWSGAKRQALNSYINGYESALNSAGWAGSFSQAMVNELENNCKRSPNKTLQRAIREVAFKNNRFQLITDDFWD